MTYANDDRHKCGENGDKIMKRITMETLANLADDVITRDVKNDAVFLSMVYDVNALDSKGEDDVQALIAAHNSLITLNIVRTLVQTFDNERITEEIKIRLLMIKKNASNLIYQMSASGADETYDRLLAYKSAKTAIDIIGRQYLALIIDYDIRNVPAKALPDYLALNAKVEFLKKEIDSEISTLENWNAEEAVASGFSLGELPDEIGLDETDEVADLPDEIGLDEIDEALTLPNEISLNKAPDRLKPYIPHQFKR